MRRGFTLIELLVVIAIMSILMATLMPAFTVANDRARVAECRAHLTAIAIALDQHRRDTGGNPPRLRALYEGGLLTDDSILLCTKTGAEYHYNPAATGSEEVIASCCAGDVEEGERPHSMRHSMVALLAGGKIVEVGR